MSGKDRPKIHLVVDRPNGRRSVIEVVGEHVTADMLAVAEDLLYALTTGERPPPKGLYEAVAKAFGTTRADAKKRLGAAMFGMSKKKFDEKERRP